MGLTRDETKHFLALVAVLDDVDTDDALLISAWQAMSEQGRWESFDAARRALLVYRSEQPNYKLRPGHITQVLERVRKVAAAEFNRTKLDPPTWAIDDADEYARWVANAAAEHQAQAMARFVAGGSAPQAIEAAS